MPTLHVEYRIVETKLHENRFQQFSFLLSLTRTIPSTGGLWKNPFWTPSCRRWRPSRAAWSQSTASCWRAAGTWFPPKADCWPVRATPSPSWGRKSPVRPCWALIHHSMARWQCTKVISSKQRRLSRKKLMIFEWVIRQLIFKCGAKGTILKSVRLY